MTKPFRISAAIALVIGGFAASANAQDDKVILSIWDQREYYGMTVPIPP